MTESWTRLREGLADRYRVGDELGHGGMAVVFHATDLRHDRPVAIKVLRPELAALLGRERFLREIRTVAQLTHPHILPLLDSGEVADQPFYVMPFVDGGTLRQRLDRSGPLPVAEAVTLARAAADALAYAHGRGFVHRDIKPENILFEAGHPVLADFGIVRALDRAGGETLTEAGMVLGTPAYMSPEQSLGTEEVDHRADQYSLACVLYESLAGEPPFTGPTTRAILAKRLGTDPPKVSVIRRTVPAALDSVIARALAVTPADRFESAGAFEAALAGASPAPASGGRPPRRGRRVAVMLLVLAALVATTVRFVSSTGLDFSAREWAVIAALDNQTGDSVFEGSLDGALAVGLQQSRYVNVVPRPRSRPRSP
ncbi:MAG: protein kinase [Gemmatimonadales bacterium]